LVLQRRRRLLLLLLMPLPNNVRCHPLGRV
jgi:hypothetical protein